MTFSKLINMEHQSPHMLNVSYSINSDKSVLKPCCGSEQISRVKPGMVVYAYNLSPHEVEARGSRVGGQLGLHSKTLSLKKQKTNNKLEPVAHTCNPSYSGGREQEDRGSKPAWSNSLR
jgi:hypothetical protein